MWTKTPAPAIACALIAAVAVVADAAHAQDNPRMQQLPSTADRPSHIESARQHRGDAPPVENPPLPEGMTLDQVLDHAARTPAKDMPNPIHDDRPFVFTLIEQLEWRIQEEGVDHLGWEAQGWIGFDYDKFWWKNEGEAAFDGIDEGESETDLLYARLITPFWHLQVGAQYANGWEDGDYDDRWSGVIALQGLAPGMFELENSLYISDEADVTFELEAEYDIRLTQRLVLQPRAALNFAFQDIPDRSLGAGLTDTNLDLRLRYEIKREFAPCIGVRFRFLTGETRQIAQDAGEDPERLFLLLGVRLQF